LGALASLRSSISFAGVLIREAGSKRMGGALRRLSTTCPAAPRSPSWWPLRIECERLRLNVAVSHAQNPAVSSTAGFGGSTMRGGFVSVHEIA
jgi:hypothetical protein